MSLFKIFFRKNWLLLFCLVIIILEFSQIFYFKRAVFTQNYDANYWKDRFEHSQWGLPLSQRIIGDDGIYSYAGYRLIKSDSIEQTNSNKPPVGIYLLGLSILIFKNPVFSEFLIGIGTIACFYFLTLELIKNKKLALMATTLFTLEPFIYSNFTITLLDLPQLFFLLLHLIFFLYAVRYKKFGLWLALISGLLLGLFAEIKPPLLLPIVLVLESIYLLKQRKFWHFIPLGLGFAVGILALYFRYFQSGHNLIDYLKLHKYMASIYSSGHNQLFPLTIWQSLLLGSFPDVVTGKITQIGTWWIVLPFITIAGLIETFKVLIHKKHPLFFKGLAIFSLTVLAIYTFVPSYARYLVLVIPFLYIFALQLLKKYAFKPIFLTMFVIISVGGLFYSSYLLLPSANDVLQGFKYNFSHQYFQDIYQEDLSAASRGIYSGMQFRKLTQQTLIDGEIINVDFKELSRSIPVFGSKGQIKYLAVYQTRNLGTFSEEKTINLVKENGTWKINWDWNLLVNSFKPGDKLMLSISPGKRGTIFNSKGETLASDESLLLIKINPDKIDTKREQEMLKFLGEITFQQGVALQNAYLENALPNSYTPVATTFIALSVGQMAKLEGYPGLILEKYNSRLYTTLGLFHYPLSVVKNTGFVERNTHIYSNTNYHGEKGIEKQYDTLLSGSNGGSLTLVDEHGNLIKTLISRKAQNGKDVIVPVLPVVPAK